MYVVVLSFAAIEMDNIDDASEISDISHINKVCALFEVSSLSHNILTRSLHLILSHSCLK